MKKLIMIMSLLFGFTGISMAQIGHNGAERRTSKKVQQHKWMATHFDKQKKDKAIEHNGTAYYMEQHKNSKYDVDKRSFASFRPVKKGKRWKGRKVMNKNFGTYTMK